MKLLLFILIIILFVLILNSGIELRIKEETVKVKIIIFSVIKIKIFEKNIKEKPKKRKKKEKKLNVKNYLFITSKSLELLKDFASKIKINLNLKLEFGFFEPDKTAIIYGLFNALIYPIDLYFKHYLKEFLSQYMIIPLFKEKRFNIDLKLVIKVQTFVLIFYLCKFILLYFKFNRKGELAYGTSN